MFIIYLLLGSFIMIIIPIVYFSDSVTLLLKIFPFLQKKDYQKYIFFTHSLEYKSHKKKWRKTFLLISLLYLEIYVIIYILFK